MPARVLIADDDSDFRLSLKDYLCSQGYEVYEAATCMEVLRTLNKKGMDLIILDLQLGKGDGIELLDKIKTLGDSLEVIMVTGYGSIETAVKALQGGVCDFVSKPFALRDLGVRIKKALELLHLKLKHEDHMQQIPVLGSSEKIKKTIKLADVLAKTEATVLISGETGTGKEVFARHIHFNSPRASEAFVVINCANLTEPMLEDEMFGHEPGAFTDAKNQRRGKVTLADKGTLFLDEIGELPIQLQAKLLRFLEERTYYRVGGDRECKADVRIIAATNRNLRTLIAKGNFREDLFYRLNVFPIELPTLRERTEDIPDLILYYFNGSSSSISPKKRYTITKEAMTLFCRYPWPGNIREIKNIVERIKILSPGCAIEEKDLPIEFISDGFNASIESQEQQQSYKNKMQQMRKKIILEALNKNNWSQTKAANVLQMDRSNLIKIMNDHNLALDRNKTIKSYT